MFFLRLNLTVNAIAADPRSLSQANLRLPRWQFAALSHSASRSENCGFVSPLETTLVTREGITREEPGDSYARQTSSNSGCYSTFAARSGSRPEVSGIITPSEPQPTIPKLPRWSRRFLMHERRITVEGSVQLCRDWTNPTAGPITCLDQRLQPAAVRPN